MSLRRLRPFVLLLVAANIVLFAWGNGYFGAASSPEAGNLRQEVHPERLIIVGNEAGGAAPAPAAPSETAPPPAPPDEKASAEEQAPTVPSPSAKCLAWYRLSDANVKRISSLLKSKHPSLKLVTSTNSAVATWWVYIPPLPNRAAAEKKAVELKELEVPEYFIVQEEGPRHYAISLGIFSNESAARERLKELQNKGVRSARIGPRSFHEGPAKTVEARGNAETVEAARNSANALSPPLHASACEEAGEH
ncbi:MAG: SPOR domain-containing protein [Betaproteobacteria bacterium]|nr:SPOR domain-containing protein [Betaproteobacteria bacterium]